MKQYLGSGLLKDTQGIHLHYGSTWKISLQQCYSQPKYNIVSSVFKWLERPGDGECLVYLKHEISEHSRTPAAKGKILYGMKLETVMHRSIVAGTGH